MLHFSYQSVDSSSTDFNAIITSKGNADLISAKTLLIICVNMKNLDSYFLILKSSGGGGPSEVIIVGATVHP